MDHIHSWAQVDHPYTTLLRRDVKHGRSQAEAVADRADPERAVLRAAVGGWQPHFVPNPVETRRETGL